MGSARSFATASTTCWPCHKAQQKVKCDACKEEKTSENFAALNVEHKNRTKANRKAVCKECQENGYSPNDIESYQCQGKCGRLRGHNKFRATDLTSAKKRSMNNLKCKDCTKDRLECFGCNKRLPQTSFEKQMWKHGQHHNQKSVCLLCTDEGVSPQDAERYICSQCNKKYGHKRFDKNEVKNFKRPDGKSQLCCEKCKPRLADLKSKVSTSTRRCFCWRTHAPGIHADTCLVSLVEGKKGGQAQMSA
jgi:hypothetical protein